jgi:hypothetical protein
LSPILGTSTVGADTTGAGAEWATAEADSGQQLTAYVSAMADAAAEQRVAEMTRVATEYAAVGAAVLGAALAGLLVYSAHSTLATGDCVGPLVMLLFLRWVATSTCSPLVAGIASALAWAHAGIAVLAVWRAVAGAPGVWAWWRRVCAWLLPAWTRRIAACVASGRAGRAQSSEACNPWATRLRRVLRGWPPRPSGEGGQRDAAEV